MSDRPRRSRAEIRALAEQIVAYAESMPDDDAWLPGEREEHQRRADADPTYLDAPRYVRPPHFTCPRCGRTSWHPNDAEAGYCGACHDFTGGP